MPSRIGSADRKILWIAAVLLTLLTLVAVLSAPAPENEATRFPSSYSATPKGALAAFLLLQRLGMKAQRWEEPPFRLSEHLSTKTVLIIAEPTEKPSHAEREALKQFVFQGGRVLFCGRNFLDFFPELIPQYVDPDEWSTAYGSGNIIRWRTAASLTNANLRDHLLLFLKGVSVNSRKEVLWDEYFHGEHGSLWDYIGRVPAIRWSLFPLAILAGAVLFTYSRRRGPVIPLPKVSRLSPLEFVESLGILYRKAKATSVPVEVNARELRLQLLRKLALPTDIEDEDLARQAAIRLGWKEQELLNALAESHQGSFSPTEALRLVQVLKRFTASLAT